MDLRPQSADVACHRSYLLIVDDSDPIPCMDSITAYCPWFLLTLWTSFCKTVLESSTGISSGKTLGISLLYFLTSRSLLSSIVHRRSSTIVPPAMRQRFVTVHERTGIQLYICFRASHRWRNEWHRQNLRFCLIDIPGPLNCCCPSF